MGGVQGACAEAVAVAREQEAQACWGRSLTGKKWTSNGVKCRRGRVDARLRGNTRDLEKRCFCIIWFVFLFFSSCVRIWIRRCFLSEPDGTVQRGLLYTLATEKGLLYTLAIMSSGTLKISAVPFRHVAPPAPLS